MWLTFLKKKPLRLSNRILKLYNKSDYFLIIAFLFNINFDNLVNRLNESKLSLEIKLYFVN